VLFSGGLDSMLVVRILQAQNIDVAAVNFQTIFTSGNEQAARAARQLDVSLTTITAGDDYLGVVRSPRFGYGQGANPCLDCRIYLLHRARQLMPEFNADFLATGDVIGQRLMGQKRRDLDVIGFHSGDVDRLLRPLCAQRLPPTLPEREGWVDRTKLYNFSGTGRRKLIALARRLGIPEIPPQTVGCLLVEKHFAAKVQQLVQLDERATSWDFELLSIGRHLRCGDQAKAIIGRNAAENARLAACFARSDAHNAALLTPDGFNGPTALVVGSLTDTMLQQATTYIVQYTHDPRAAREKIRVEIREAKG
jgi:hypothetical protein